MKKILGVIVLGFVLNLTQVNNSYSGCEYWDRCGIKKSLKIWKNSNESRDRKNANSDREYLIDKIDKLENSIDNMSNIPNNISLKCVWLSAKGENEKEYLVKKSKDIFTDNTLEWNLEYTLQKKAWDSYQAYLKNKEYFDTLKLWYDSDKAISIKINHVANRKNGKAVRKYYFTKYSGNSQNILSEENDGNCSKVTANKF